MYVEFCDVTPMIRIIDTDDYLYLEIGMQTIVPSLRSRKNETFWDQYCMSKLNRNRVN
jgi:hypothetical protein